MTRLHTGHQVIAIALAGTMGFFATAALAETIHFHADLSGANESPPNDGPAGGMADLTLDTETLQLEWTVSYHDMSGPLTGAHIHGPAAPGANAGILIAFDGIEQSPFTGSTLLAPEEIDQITSSMFYVNLHTAAHPGGEVRGTIEVVDDMMGE